MASRTKETWTPAEWIAFGNRVKRVRSELQAMIGDVQHVCRVRELDGLLKVVRQIDRWKPLMENLAARQVPDAIITRIFYGDCLPEDADPVDGIVLRRKYVCEHTDEGVEALVYMSEGEGDVQSLKDQHGIGFHMGYNGAGPNNLAASILADALADELAPAFAGEVINDMPNAYQDTETVAVLTQQEVVAWVMDKLRESVSA